MSEQNKDQDQEILRQYLDSIKEEEERKKAQNLARLSRLNIGIAVFLSLLIDRPPIEVPPPRPPTLPHTSSNKKKETEKKFYISLNRSCSPSCCCC